MSTSQKKKLKHSKIKNTGILFELLARQITSDILNKKKSDESQHILKKYFGKSTELHKEHKIYTAILSTKNKKQSHILSMLDEALERARQLNTRKLSAEKYNLVGEIKSTYGDVFFKSTLPDYKLLASIYKLITIEQYPQITTEIGERTRTKEFLIESLVNSKSSYTKSLKQIDPEESFNNRIAWKILAENFNKKYEGLNKTQKHLLKLYIENTTDSPELRNSLLKEMRNIRKSLMHNLSHVDDDVLKIKVKHVLKKINVMNEKIEKGFVKDELITGALLYSSLAEQLKKLKRGDN